MARLFVSYSSDDQPIVRELVRHMEAAGHSVWWDRDIAAGTRYEERIERELSACDIVVVVWSSSSISSPWVRAEAQEGLSRNILVPLCIDDVRPPMAFRAIETAFLVGWPERENPVELKALLIGIDRVTGEGNVQDATMVVRDDPTLSERVARRLAAEPDLTSADQSPSTLIFERALTDLLARALMRAGSGTTSLKLFAQEISEPLSADHVFFELDGMGHSVKGSPAVGQKMNQIADEDAANTSTARIMGKLSATPVAGDVDWLIYITAPNFSLVAGGGGICPAAESTIRRLSLIADLSAELRF